MDLASSIAAVSAVTGLLALAWAAWSFRQTSELNAFLTFTERYEAIMNELPHEARATGKWGPETDTDFAIRLRYLNLCSEEFYLWKRRLLSSKVWEIWEEEMKRALASEPYLEAWHHLRPQFDSFAEFSAHVDMIQSECRLGVEPSPA